MSKDIVITMQDGGVIKAELYPQTAPITVENFVKLIEQKFFDGLVFHRVISGFMIQGGGYDEAGDHKETESIKGEFAANGVTNDLKHTRAWLAFEAYTGCAVYGPHIIPKLRVQPVLYYASGRTASGWPVCSVWYGDGGDGCRG